MPRNVCITAVDGQTGHLIAELLLTNEDFSSKVDSVVGLSLKPNDPKCRQLAKLGAKIVAHHPGKERDMVSALKGTGADAICIVPPAHKDKFDITSELISATKRAEIPNFCFLSSAGCDYADPKKQPRLHEFLELEQLVLAAKGDPNTATGHSPVVIRYVLQLLFEEVTVDDELELVSMLKISCSTRLKLRRKDYFRFRLGRTINLLRSHLEYVERFN